MYGYIFSVFVSGISNNLIAFHIVCLQILSEFIEHARSVQINFTHTTNKNVSNFHFKLRKWGDLRENMVVIG
jgi:hypothetical protein